jgi:hypothetical protein
MVLWPQRGLGRGGVTVLWCYGTSQTSEINPNRPKWATPRPQTNKNVGIFSGRVGHICPVLWRHGRFVDVLWRYGVMGLY